MSETQFIYAVSPSDTPFSVTPGGLSNFAANSDSEPSLNASTRISHISWILRDRMTNQTFTARQDISTDHAALYASIVSDIPLNADHLYETLEVSVPVALSTDIQPARKSPKQAQNRLGVARGTHVMTSRGEVPVEQLTAGDRVITRDHGMQTIRWVGSENVTVSKDNAPVLFRAGSIKNSRDLIVSADHRVVLKGAEAMMLYGAKEVLIPSQRLVNGQNIIFALSGEVEFFQIITDRHEVIYCEASANESFMPDENGISVLSDNNKSEILNALPVLAAASNCYGPAARGFVEV